jgi:alkanesulfonate monooxygenase SsuD/methylene tetrahydromethanopterin reductase-like flavin-dependent oxidoreductase (luciferase family)
MKIDTMLGARTLEGFADQARVYEEMGFDGLWTVEAQHDPFLPLSAVAPATRRVSLGTAIAVAFPRSPMILAHIAWDLQAYTRGRFILGLGTQVKGHNERRFSVRGNHPARGSARSSSRFARSGTAGRTARSWISRGSSTSTR